MGNFQIALLPGDGVGPEVVRQAVKVLEAVGRRFGHTFRFREAPVGGAALEQTDNPLPPETLRLCQSSDAVLLGAVGGPKWDDLPSGRRPEKALLGLRKELRLFANLRPARVRPLLVDVSPLKRPYVESVDLVVVRELTGGIYFGTPRGWHQEGALRSAFNTLVYNNLEVERIARKAFELARLRRKKVTSVDKANILECSQLWRKVVTEVSRDYQDVTLNHIYIDNCVMQLMARPSQFDVILADNMFGDILSDAAAILTGSIGMLPSASLGGKVGLYEPVHGSAPDIAGQDLANPIATIESASLMLAHSFGLHREAAAVETAVDVILGSNYRTMDILQEGCTRVGTAEMGDLIARKMETS
ncbi:MAG: 3-isopropylmalate dehydrogenase [Acidobacteria bacterium]|nr:3-isopropylmalate dehydrogenase [Acidobacteriota bacterium]